MSSFLDKLKNKKIVGADGTSGPQQVKTEKDTKNEEKDSGELPTDSTALDVDLFRTEESLVLFAHLPGVRSQDLKVVMNKEGDVLEIRAEKKRPEVGQTKAKEKEAVAEKERKAIVLAREQEDKKKEAIFEECKWGSFYRKINLPDAVESCSVEAGLDKGVLTVKMPLIKFMGNKKIEVMGKESKAGSSGADEGLDKDAVAVTKMPIDNKDSSGQKHQSLRKEIKKNKVIAHLKKRLFFVVDKAKQTIVKMVIYILSSFLAFTLYSKKALLSVINKLKKGGVKVVVVLAGSFFIFNICLIAPSPVFAAGATLFLSPSSGSYTVGDSFTVSITINSGGGVGINAADGTLKFDPGMLSASTPSKTGSIFSLWTSNPVHSNTAGTVIFSGGNPGPYTGTSGKVLSVTFKALKEGTTKITFPSGSVLAADGKGTNVLSSKGEGNYTIKHRPVATPRPTAAPTPTPAQVNIVSFVPKITSLTHPEADKWYANNNPQFTWNIDKTVSSIRTSIDKDPEGIPTTSYTPAISEKTVADLTDGIWYFHLRAKNSSGWGDVASRKVMIDTARPSDFEISVKQKDAADNYPLLLFESIDELSGVVYYEVKIGDNASIQVSVETIRSNPYRSPFMDIGEHMVFVKAFDAAGNFAESQKIINIAKAEDVQTAEAASNQVFAESSWMIFGKYTIQILIVICILLLLLLLILLLQRKQSRVVRKKSKEKTSALKTKMKEIFESIREEVEEQVRIADKKPALSDSEKAVIEKLRDALDISEELIKREIEELEKHI